MAGRVRARACAWATPSPAPAAAAGRLYQVEYAITAIQNAAAAVGVQCAEGIVVACEKRVASKLLAPPKASEKTYKLDEHVRRGSGGGGGGASGGGGAYAEARPGAARPN